MNWYIAKIQNGRSEIFEIQAQALNEEDFKKVCFEMMVSANRRSPNACGGPYKFLSIERME